MTNVNKTRFSKRRWKFRLGGGGSWIELIDTQIIKMEKDEDQYNTTNNLSKLHDENNEMRDHPEILVEISIFTPEFNLVLGSIMWHVRGQPEKTVWRYSHDLHV